MQRSELNRRYFELGNELPKIYPKKNFYNHCYWRIALDNTVGDKWKNVIQSPAYKNLSDGQIKEVVGLLKIYRENEDQLMRDNEKSLEWRRNPR